MELQWNERRESYEAEWPDGRRFLVDGDIWTDRLLGAMAEKFAERERETWSHLSDEGRRQRISQELMDDGPIYQEVELKMRDPLSWSEGMAGVEVFCEDDREEDEEDEESEWTEEEQRLFE